MIEVEQEESSAPVAAVEAESPAQSTAEVTAIAETEAKAVVNRTKRVVRNAVSEVKSAAETTKVAISAEEHNICLKMENQFLQITAQIVQLQKQAEGIQKQYPEHIKGLASKYGVDLAKNTFNAIEGVFTKNQ